MQFFIGFGYEVNVRFNFRSQQTHAGMQVLSAILFRVAFQSLYNWESPFAKYEHGEHIFNAKSLKRGQFPGCPTLVAGLVTLQFFQNWFPRSSVVFSVCFFEFGAVMPLSLNEQKLFRNGYYLHNLTRHCGLPLLFTKEYLFSQLELSFLFSSDTSLLKLIFC